MHSYQAIRGGILAALPSLRAYAVSLTGSRDRADDLVTETLVRALGHTDTMRPGTSMLAWLITILRGMLLSEQRDRRGEVEHVDGEAAGRLVWSPEQERSPFQEVRSALLQLPLNQRDAIVLVAASGFSYREAAQISGCPVGTIKSRVNRARNALARALAGPDGLHRRPLDGGFGNRDMLLHGNGTVRAC